MKTMKKISLMLMAALAMLAVSCDDKNDGGDNGGGGSGSGNEEVYTTLGTQQSKDNAAICWPTPTTWATATRSTPSKGT